MKLIHKVADCDLHPGRPAEYDEPLAPRGQWGNVCGECHDSLSLGSVSGYRLTRDPDHPDLRENQSKDDIRAGIKAALDAGDFDAAEDLIGDGDLMEYL